MTAFEWLETKVRQQQVEHEAQRRRQWEAINRVWEKCCKAEGIDDAADFIAFSADNPYLAEYQQVLRAYVSTSAK